MESPARADGAPELAWQCAAEGVDHVRYLLRLAELEVEPPAPAPSGCSPALGFTRRRPPPASRGDIVRGGVSCHGRWGIGFAGAPWYLWGMSRKPGNAASPEFLAPSRGPDGGMARSTRCARGRARRARLAAIAVAAVMCLVSSAAVAGDYYLRGGIGLDRPGKANSTDVDYSTTAPAALYGCGTGGDGARLRSAGDFGTVPTVELGLGYAKGAARFELLVEYRPRFEFEGRANFLAPGQRESVSAKLSSVSGMLAVFADLAALGAPKAGPFAPFVGAGIGIAHTRIGKTAMTFPATTTTVPGGDRTGLGLNGDGRCRGRTGRARDSRSGLALHGPRRSPNAAGPGRVVWRDGSREPLPLDLAPTKARLKGHGIRLSLRYAF